LIRQVPDEGALDGKPVVLFVYETQAEAKAARTDVQAAVEKATIQIEDALFFEARYVRSQTGRCISISIAATEFAFWLPPADALEKFFSTTL